MEYRHIPEIPDAHWAKCSDVARIHGKTFYFACQSLPKPKRRAIHAVYAFCRTADDIVDEGPWTRTDIIRQQLDAWETEVERPRSEVATSFKWVREQYGIAEGPVHDLFAGLRSDLEATSFTTWDDLDHYCYCVAGTVGLMTMPILGCSHPESAHNAAALGKAMQLTNILRDIAEDAAVGRVYLPEEDLEVFGVTRESILAHKPTGNYRGLIDFQIVRARALFQVGMAGIPYLDPTGRVAAYAGAHLYSKILDRIAQRDFDGFAERASISTTRKIRELPSVAAALFRMSLARPT